MENTPKETLNELVNRLTYKDPISEEEFENCMDMLASYLLFGTKWERTIANNPKIRRKIPILADVTLICKADECPYAEKCPIMRQITTEADKVKLIGTECRADKLYALEEFSEFVRDLQIDPQQTTDIINVASLVRLLILKRRIDWTLAIEGIMGNEPGIIDQRSGLVYYKKVVHPLLKVSESLEKQVATLQKQLMADRQARAALASQMGNRGTDILRELFSGDLKSLEKQNTIDAEFSSIDEEVEE